MHDVPLATRFADRIVGLSRGAVVFDGEPAALTTARLTEIYGEEEWEPPELRDSEVEGRPQ
jgi:phosphonate transport system ATP-binding protein